MKKRLLIIKTLRYFSLIAIILFSSLPTTSYALNGVFDPDFYQSNDILFYNPGSAAKNCTYLPVVSTPLDVPVLKGKDNDERIWNFLTDPKQGLTKEQAAGIMGNIEHDSNYNPAFEENPESKDAGYGIASWSFGRRTTLTSAAKNQNISVSDLGFQLAFMMQEAQSNEIDNGSADAPSGIGDMTGGTTGSTSIGGNDNQWEALKRKKTIEEATSFWYTNYEDARDGAVTPRQRPAGQPGFINDNPGPLADRLSKAQKAYDKFSSKTTESNDQNPTDSNTGSSSSTTSSGNGCSLADGNFQQTVLAYAWPEYHESPFVDMMPAYAEAVKERQSQGKWVGGYSDGPGIDCGGFVTILLVNSGFEPRYNYEDKSGWGAVATGQLPWLEENWTLLGRGGSISSLDLQPGDVAIKIPATHTYIYVGQIEGFGNTYASASLGNRSPMAARASNENVEQTNYNWYRKK